ncbi:hypothetical protein C4572_01610 [Candidatus Parcubacteria bacterium]|nr:MAG: hypothetical protein C4572_01610 [Candidatus Parcubacteria bacterium]
MKKHSFLSYLFWVTLAIASGIMVAQLTNAGVKETLRFASSFGKPIVYEAKSLQKAAVKEIGKEAMGLVGKTSKIALGNIFQDRSGPPKNSGKYIEADLSKMTISLYQDGKLKESLEIRSKGRPGSPWETPTGEYAVLLKEKEHFSSIGGVWMPNSIQFFGNFFIHGWPYFKDGTPVYEGYSGGCIRLSTEDSEKVFAFAEIETPIYITNSSLNFDQFNDNSYYSSKVSIKSPRLSAEAYLVADAETGEIILEKNKDEKYPIASITKLMTALASLETIDQSKITAVPNDLDYENYNISGLSKGEIISVGDLIYPLLLQSSNTAAEAIADFRGRANFIRGMNQKAAAIGLLDTSFSDPSGLSEKNLSTPSDIFKFISYLHKGKRHILEITKLKEGTAGTKKWTNSNKFISFGNFDGGKTGYTEAARKTFAGIFSLPLAEFNERKIVVAVFRSQQREDDVIKILDYLKDTVYYGRQP